MTDRPTAAEVREMVEHLRSWNRCWPGNINLERAVERATEMLIGLQRQLDDADKLIGAYAILSGDVPASGTEFEGLRAYRATQEPKT